jgi:Phage tail assembly chaperone proteins, E, or 41 or 14
MADTRTKQIALPSGRTVTIREGRGRDLIQAQRAVGRAAESTALLQALVAILCQIDGKALIYEDVLDMPVADVLMLEAEVLGNFPVGQAPSLSSQMPPASPASSISASPPATSTQ